MKKTLIKLSTLICFPIILASCAYTADSGYIKQVTEEPLADGSKTRVGYILPEPAWKCRQLYRKSDTWMMDKFQGMVKMGGSYQVLQEQAITYANKNHLKPNYIYLYVPSETRISGFSLSPLADADVIYYQCKNPPAINDKLFKLN